MTVTDLLERMTVAELQDWNRFFTYRLFPDEAQDLQHGHLCALIANIMRGKDQEASSPADWMVLHIDREDLLRRRDELLRMRDQPPVDEVDKFLKLMK